MASLQSEFPQQDPIVDVHNPNHYKVGTLTYTKMGLVSLFVFLLWGDFCWALMETVIPSVLPLKFADIHADNWELGLIMATIPSLMTTIINPIVSFKSDRYRSKWGRRIPFLAGVTPFLVVFLTLLGFEEDVTRWVHQTILGGKYSDATVGIWVIGVLMVGFQFFNLFTQAIFYYLFNDVVPHAFLARFVALFRIAGGAAGMFYNYFIYQYAKDHMGLVFLGAAVLFAVGYGMMCWKVKEGEYPPPPPYVNNEHGLVASIKTYATECFSHRFYWYIFLASSCQAMTWVSGAFGLLLNTHYMGFDLVFLGKLGFWTGLVGMILNYPGGIIADRFHPLRVIIFAIGVHLLLSPIGQCFVFFWRPHMTLHDAHYFQFALSMLTLPLGIVAGAAELPMLMKLLPQERYGQFCSANAMVRGLAMAIGGVGCGLFLDHMKIFNPNPDYCYRFVGLWNLAGLFGYFFFLNMVHREWKKLGGLTNYVPPKAEPSKRLIAGLNRIFGK